MPFQTVVRQFYAGGLIGEISRDGPTRAQNVILRSADPNNNVIGRAATFVDTPVGAKTRIVQVGVPVSDTNPFAGILAFPKQLALRGSSTNPLDPTLLVPNENNIDVISMGFLYIALTNAGNVGWNIYASNTTGELIAGLASAPPADAWLVPNTTLYGESISAAGVAEIRLTN